MAGRARPSAPATKNAPPAGGASGGASKGNIVQQLGGGRNVAMGGGVVAVVALALYRKHHASKSAAASSTNNLGQTIGYIPAGYSDTANDPMQVYTGYDQVEQQIAALQNQLNNPGTAPNKNPPPRPVPIHGGNPPHGPGGPISGGANGLVSVIPAPPATPPAASPPSGGSSNHEYTVVSGDNLWNIAKRFFNGDGTQWRKIFNANRSVIGNNPDLIRPGEHLEIPA